MYNTLQWARTHCRQQKLQLLRYGTHKLHGDRQAGPRQQPCRHNQRNTGYAIWGAEQGTAAALAHTQHSTPTQRLMLNLKLSQQARVHHACMQHHTHW